MFTIIGDVHGEWYKYKKLTEQYKYTVQLGDLGYDYEKFDELNIGDNHVFFPGNHDNYDTCFQSEHCLGDYGYIALNGAEFFFIRGGYSIDYKYRRAHYLRTGVQTYFENEELSIAQGNHCLDLYCKIKPDIVITHECPRSIVNLFANTGKSSILWQFGFDPATFTTRTSEILQACFEAHKPKQWFFGHYHRDWTCKVEGTQFTCLSELSTYELK